MAEGAERRTFSAADDLALVRGILDGDRAQLPLLAERLHCIPRALQLLDQKNGQRLGREELTDLAQDVLVVVWKKLGSFAGYSSLEGWVWGTCVLEYQAALRRKRRLNQEASQVASRTGIPEEVAVDPDPWAFEDVHAGLARLEVELEQVLRRKHFGGQTFEEIGRQLGLSPNTVKTRYYRGLRELRVLLERSARKTEERR